MFLLDAQVVDDETPSFVGVLTHVELQQVVDRVVRNADPVEPHLADKLLNSSGETLPRPLNRVILGIDAGAGHGFRRPSSE